MDSFHRSTESIDVSAGPTIFEDPTVRNLMDEFATPFKSFNSSREHMNVFLRVRPFTENEKERGEDEVFYL